MNRCRTIKSGMRRRRDGYVMVLVAMLLFGLMAMAALVIDIGFARLAQRQMQTAADAAALEGLRGEGGIALLYADRQQQAEQIIAWTFDDDLNPDNGDVGVAGDGGAFGAGPLIDFSGGVENPSLNAGQFMTIDQANAAYKPVMQRAEETPGTFHIAIQRGGGLVGEPNLFAVGPTVPYLFARGSSLNRELIGNGMTVRAAAFAETRPAVRVGPSVGGLPGVEPVAFSLADWGPSPTNPVSISSDVSAGLMIGEVIVVGAAITPLTTGYCVVYNPTTNRVVGFGDLASPSPATGIVALHNATARLSDVWETLGTMTQADRDSIVSANRSLTHALNAPVLVRN